MKKSTSCQCQSTCQTKRCLCIKSGRACADQCQCQNCKNPFNGMKSAEKLNDCARENIKEIVSLSAIDLDKEYQLPCGCSHAPLKSLIENHICHGCEEGYYYSFCLGDVMDTNSMWHCNACGTCREDSEWHCKKCNTCTYGLTLKCENCGKKSPYAPRGL